MDVAAFWDRVKTALGLDQLLTAELLAKTLQILIIILITVWIAQWLSRAILNAARARRTYAEVAALTSRAAALAVFAAGTTVILAILGANWTAIAAVLGAATFGISLALQDVGRSFVNGIYILVERPFRIGDWVRIGGIEGRVEEVGVRLTALRTHAGERVIVPNTVVFSSIIENSSINALDRQKYSAGGIERPITEIQGAVVESLRGTPHLSQRSPTVDIIQASPEGTNIEVTVEHDQGHHIDSDVIDRLRALFPEATVGTKTPANVG